MSRNYIIAFAAATAVLAALALAGWALFETEPVKKWVQPSREARRNPYLALDRWLNNNGIPVRTEPRGDLSTISGAAEKHIFLQASLFRWNNAAVNYLGAWVEDGGNLFLVLDYRTVPLSSYISRDEDMSFREEEPYAFLEEFGITVDSVRDYYNSRYDSEAPAFERDASFQVSEDTDALIVRDWTGHCKLVRVKRGEGTLTVSGQPRFMRSNFIGEAPNASLAWTLFAETDAAKEGWLFIRGTTKVRGLLGNLWRQGNFAVLIVSILILLTVSFWAALPMFGLVKKEDDRPLKALRERFLAEGRFLKQYGALDMYIKAYIREIKKRLAGKEGLIDNNDIERRLIEILGTQEDKSALLIKALRGDRFSYGEFPGMVIILKTILEKI